MENTLLVGDRLIINKLAFGPRIPRSIVEVPWIHGLVFLLNKEEYNSQKELASSKHIKRWTGFSTFKRNDIIVFESPKEASTLLVKRLVGLPGDTIELKNGRVFINGSKQQNPKKGKLWYEASINDTTLAYNFLDSLGRNHFKKLPPEDSIFLLNIEFTSEDLLLIKDYHFISNIKIKQSSQLRSNKNWTYNNFGPIIIPRKGTKIILKDSIQRENYFHEYGFGIKIENHCNLSITSNQCIINEDYFFVLGDNRNNSIDSRSYGLIPATSIIGKNSMILFSSNKKSSFFSRLLKYIN